MRKNRLIIPALLAFLSMQGYAQEPVSYTHLTAADE